MTRTLTLASMALLMSSTSLYALEGKALFDELRKGAKSEISYGSLEETSADSFTLRDVKITGRRDAVTTAGSLTFKSLREDGSKIVIGEMSASNYKAVTPPSRGRETEGNVTFGSFTVKGIDAPRELFGGDIAKVRGERVKIESLAVSNITGDQDGDGTADYEIAGIGIEALDTPLDWRFDPTMKADATGDPAAPLTLKAATMDGMTAKTPSGSFSLASVAVNDLRVPTSTDVAPMEWARVYSSMTLGEMDVQMGGQKVFGSKAITAAVTPSGDNAIQSTSALEGLFVDLTAIPDPRFQAFAGALGYTTLTGRMDGNGSYDIETGEVAVDKVALELDDVAALSVSYKMTGYTPELAQKITELSAATAPGRPPNTAAMMGLLSQLKLSSAEITLKDDSLTKRLLTFQAGKMNTTAEQLAAGAPMFIAMGMAQLGTPDFTQQVSQAVGSFLADPGTLSLTAKPTAPVAIMDLAAAAQRAPSAVIEMLNVGVAATK